MHQIRQATREDAYVISGILRVEDTAEVLAASGKHPREVMPLCVDPFTRVWTVNGSYAAMYGVNEVSHNVGVPWMVATDILEDYAFFFGRHCCPVIKAWSQMFPLLTNCVDARNTLHIKWLKRAGFQFIELLPEWGAARLPFWRFEMQTNV